MKNHCGGIILKLKTKESRSEILSKSFKEAITALENTRQISSRLDLE
jgi:hypothetical protein